MRIGLLGPAELESDSLERAARRLLADLAPDRVIYLGVDGALDQVVHQWAQRLVGEDPTDEGLWSRAADHCPDASWQDLDDFVQRERDRQRLRLLESLPDAKTRVVELIAGAVAVMLHDRKDLTEEDMLPARLLLFGKSAQPIIRQVGPRWFLAPGSQDVGGTLLLDDTDTLTATVYDCHGTTLRHEVLALSRGTKMTVAGP
jgi:hypothetical protein